MPELPEVETIARRLRDLLINKKIASVEVHRDKSFQGEPVLLEGQTIQAISRRAKIIRVHLSNDLNLLIHLKMTGQLIYVDDQIRVGGGHPTADWVSNLPSKHTRVTITFHDGARLYFNDLRVFGWIKVLSTPDVEQILAVLAPDIIDPQVTPEYLYPRFQARKQSIKQAIMDSALVAGVGNIYACDALNLAQIDPHRSANSLSLNEAVRLIEATKTVVNRGIEMDGATIDDFTHVDGFAGKYQEAVQVYGRAGLKCYQCGGTIVKTKLGGRGTYYCNSCQV